MRKPTLKDITEVQIILNEAKECPVGQRLADILNDIEPECYNKAMILISDFIVNPTVATTDTGKQTVLVFSKFKESGAVCPKGEDIDNLLEQYRWDMVCQIWNQMNMTTEEIKDL